MINYCLWLAKEMIAMCLSLLYPVGKIYYTWTLPMTKLHPVKSFKHGASVTYQLLAYQLLAHIQIHSLHTMCFVHWLFHIDTITYQWDCNFVCFWSFATAHILSSLKEHDVLPTLHDDRFCLAHPRHLMIIWSPCGYRRTGFVMRCIVHISPIIRYMCLSFGFGIS